LLRILHIDTGRQMRGGQQQLLLLARGLRERGHEQVIACPDDSPLAARARQQGFRVTALGHGGLVRAASSLRREAARAGIRILHAHDGRSQTISALGSLGLEVQRVATRRVTFMPPRLGTLGLHRLQYGPTCDAIIAVSRFVRDLLVGSGIAAAKIEVIYDGIEIPPALPGVDARHRARAQWGLDPEAFVIGHLGAFTPEKGQDVLLEAFLQARASGLAGAQLLLAGEGPGSASARTVELIRRAANSVRLTGWIEDLTAFFAALDLYVMPSRAEGLGSAALLAIAHGLPVVASRAGGLPEVIEEGVSGWLVPPGSPVGLVRGLMEAASDRLRLRQIGARAREAAARFASDIMVSQTESLYLRLASPA
jgi:glycosyltransferase involved in cell wall biosynthesis